MELLLANPRGFCAGVDRAIEIVERALVLHGAPIYVRHEVVHNQFVVNGLRQKGAIFIEDLADVPSGSILIFSAHGVAKAVRADAEARGLKVFDATCPLVTKVHVEVAKMLKQGLEIVMIGHRGHPEAEGTMGQADSHIHLVETVADVAGLRISDPAKVAYVTQTTLSVDDAEQVVAALRARFPQIRGPKKADICYATQNRQDAVKLMAPRCDAVIVVGSPNSSNSNRLREVARNIGTEAYMIDRAADLRPEWIAGKRRIGVTAGASAPEVLVNDVLARLKELGAARVSQLEGISENVVFTLPRALARQRSALVGRSARGAGGGRGLEAHLHHHLAPDRTLALPSGREACRAKRARGGLLEVARRVGAHRFHPVDAALHNALDDGTMTAAVPGYPTTIRTAEEGRSDARRAADPAACARARPPPTPAPPSAPDRARAPPPPRPAPPSRPERARAGAHGNPRAVPAWPDHPSRVADPSGP